MSERYTRRCTLPAQSKPDNSDVPVSVEARALLVDNQLGKLLAQVKYKNDSPKSIKAITVNIEAFDAGGVKINAPRGYDYERLMAGSGETFGEKALIEMPDANADTFTVEVTAVAFSDGSGWSKLGEQATETTKTVAKAAAKTSGWIAALIVNIFVTVVMAGATVLGFKDGFSNPKTAVGNVAMVLMTLISIPGAGRLIFRKNYGVKQRVLRWVIFAAIAAVDMVIVHIVL